MPENGVDTSGAAQPPRRGRPSQPQQERSAETRMRLIEATIECLSTHGLAATTTALVSKTAGVTRGAYLHHFGSREQLIAEAFGYMLESLMGEIEKRVATAVAEGRPEDLLDEIWRHGFNDRMFGGFEILLMCRRDAELRRHWAAYSAKYRAWRRRLFSDIVGRELEEDSPVLCFLDGFLDMLRGMALMDVVRTKRATRAQLEYWRDVFRREIARVLEEAKRPDGAAAVRGGDDA